MKSRRILIPISIVVALVLAALFWLLCTGPGVRAVDAPVADVVSTPAQRLALVEADGLHARDRENIAAPAPIQRLPDFAEAEGVRLVVVDGGSRCPVPGASVHVFDNVSGRFGPTTNYEHWMGPDVAGFVAARSPEIVSDTDGAVDLPIARNHRFITARKADKLGFAEIDPRDRGLFEIEIVPTHDLDVRVRDVEGKPLGDVRVGLYACSGSDSLWDGVTDQRGICRVADCELLTRSFEFGQGELVAVRLALPFEPLVEEWIDLTNIPSTPIDLVMPASGSMSFTIVDQDHHVVRVPGTLFIFSADTTAQTRLQPERQQPTGRVAFENGVARIDGIGLGQELSITADMPGDGDSGIEVRGPKAQGEVVPVEIEFLGGYTLLEGRIVDSAGHPLARMSFDWLRTADDGHSIKASALNVFTTDGEGRFVWTMRSVSEPDLGPITHRDGYLCEVSSALERRQARLKFPLEFTETLTDLGDIVAPVGPPLVSGHVVDEAGHGIADAVAGVGVIMRPGTWQTGGMNPMFPACSTRADGGFGVFFPCLDLRLALCVQTDKNEILQIVPFVCGGGPLDVTVKGHATARLMGTALVDRGALLDELEVRYSIDGTDPDRQFTAQLTRAGDRVCFCIPNLPLTTGRIELDCAASNPSLHVVFPEIRITVPGDVRPVQLVDVDLRGKLPLAASVAPPTFGEIEIVDTRGQSVPHGLLWVWNAAEEQTLHHWTGGRLSIHETDVQRVEIWAAGFRERVLQPVPRSARVVLDPELELELQFDIPHEFRDAGVTLRGRIAFALQAGTEFVPSAIEGDATFAVDREGRALMRLPAPGTFEATLSLSRVGVPGMDDIPDDEIGVQPMPLVVRDVVGRQTIECTLDDYGVEQALESLGITHK